MQRKTLIATLLAAAFVFPLTANAGDANKPAGAKTAAATNGANDGVDKSADAKTANGANDGGAEAMFKAMDKDTDGAISKAEAADTPHAATFDQLDKNRDGKLSREEHADAPEHVAGRSGAKAEGAAASTSASPSTEATGSKKTY